jgi:hypothetical protein
VDTATTDVGDDLIAAPWIGHQRDDLLDGTQIQCLTYDEIATICVQDSRGDSHDLAHFLTQAHMSLVVWNCRTKVVVCIAALICVPSRRSSRSCPIHGAAMRSSPTSVVAVSTRVCDLFHHRSSDPSIVSSSFLVSIHCRTAAPCGWRGRAPTRRPPNSISRCSKTPHSAHKSSSSSHPTPPSSAHRTTRAGR